MAQRLEDSYTRYPRPILWLLRGGEAFIGGEQIHVDSFYLSKLPVSNRQYEAFDSGHRRPATSPGDDDPAVGIGFEDARGYCTWYARVARKPMRLPTEIEWEFACRAGAAARFFFGEDPDDAEPFVWDAANSEERVPPLGRKMPNPFGLYGMLGGVWEWTDSGALRGGSFRSVRGDVGCADRLIDDSGARRDDAGFRIARSL